MLTEAQILLAKHLRELELCPEFEYTFARGRRWRFDIALEDQHIGIEIEGGAWTRGRHTRGAGFIADLEKYNNATMLGWRVLRFTPQQVLSGAAKAWIAGWLESTPGSSSTSLKARRASLKRLG
jgi:very-short-patch-repair endonuclease